MAISVETLLVFFGTLAVCGLYITILCVHTPRGTNLGFKESLVIWYRKSRLGQYLEIFQGLASVVSGVLFVVETYYRSTPISLFYLELAFSTTFLSHFLLGLYMSNSFRGYLTEFSSVVDIITVTPVMVVFVAGETSFTGSGVLSFMRILRFARVLRLLRIFRSLDLLSEVSKAADFDNAIMRELMVLVCKLACLIICSAGLVQYIANDLRDCAATLAELEEGKRDCGADWGMDAMPGEDPVRMEFVDAIYFTVVTVSTVGYGDVSPYRWEGRLVCVLIIALAIVLVPMESNKLLELIRLQPEYGGYFEKRGAKQKHVLLLSDDKCSGVSGWLDEFFHEDHGTCDTIVVVLCPGLPDDNVKQLLMQKGGKSRGSRLHFLRGDAIQGDDLLRARTDTAECCFILTNKFAADNDAMDSRTVLRAVAIKNFNPSLETFVQVIEPENKMHVCAAGVHMDHILCIDELKMNLMGQNCRCMGFATLVANLVASSSISPDASYEMEWQREYAMGMTQELYAFDIGKEYWGLTFIQVSLMVYDRVGATMFAVGTSGGGSRGGRVPRRSTGTGPRASDSTSFATGDRKIWINPGRSYTVKEGDVGYVIAPEQQVVDELNPELITTTVFESTAKSVKEVKKGMSMRQRVAPAASTSSARVEKRAASMEEVEAAAKEALSPDKGRGEGGEEGPREESPPKQMAALTSIKRMPVRAEVSFRMSGGAVRHLTPPAPSRFGSTPSAPSAAAAAVVVAAAAAAVTPSTPSAGGGGLPPKPPGAPSAAAGGEGGGAQAPRLTVSPAPSRPASSRGGVGSRPMSGRQLLGVGAHDDIPSLLGALELSEYLPAFEREKVTTRSLAFIGDADLRDTLGLPLGPRRLVMQYIEEQRASRGRSGRGGNSGRSLGAAGTAGGRGGAAIALDEPGWCMVDELGDEVEGHYLIITESIDDINFLLQPLRSHARVQRPVVILGTRMPTDDEWDELTGQENIFVVVGNPMDVDVLRRCAIGRAHMAIVLTPDDAEGMDFSTVDAKVILTVMGIASTVGTRVDVITELYHTNFARHLRPRGTKTLGMSYSFEPSYSSGRVVSASWLENVLAMAYYNPGIISVIKRLVSGNEKLSKGVKGMRALAAADAIADDSSEAGSQAGGEASGSGAGAAKARRSTENPGMAPLPEEFPHAHPEHIPVPEEMAGRTYKELFALLSMSMDIVPIGLYRSAELLPLGTERGPGARVRDNPLQYVVTNPVPETIVDADDLVFGLVSAMQDAWVGGSQEDAGPSTPRTAHVTTPR